MFRWCYTRPPWKSFGCENGEHHDSPVNFGHTIYPFFSYKPFFPWWCLTSCPGHYKQWLLGDCCGLTRWVFDQSCGCLFWTLENTWAQLNPMQSKAPQIMIKSKVLIKMLNWQCWPEMTEGIKVVFEISACFITSSRSSLCYWSLCVSSLLHVAFHCAYATCLVMGMTPSTSILNIPLQHTAPRPNPNEKTTIWLTSMHSREWLNGAFDSSQWCEVPTSCVCWIINPMYIHYHRCISYNQKSMGFTWIHLSPKKTPGSQARSLDDGAKPCSSWSLVPSVPCAATRRHCWEPPLLRAADGEKPCWWWKPLNSARWNLPLGEVMEVSVEHCWFQGLGFFRIATLIQFDCGETRCLWEGSPTYWADMLAMMEVPRMWLCVPLWSPQPQSSSTKRPPPPGLYPNCYTKFKEDLWLIYETKKYDYLISYY